MIMNLLERYIAKTVLSSMALVTLMLVSLQIFILFVDQLDSLSKGDYSILQAAILVLLQMPYQVYLFFPMASLLGCLIGLGLMANNHELVVMRSSGMSVGQITAAILKVSVLVIGIVSVVSETMLPKMVSIAHDQRTQALSGGQTLRTARGVWMRDHNDFINIGAIISDHVLENVRQFHFDSEHNLLFVRKIAKVEYVNSGWRAYDVLETKIYNDKTVVGKFADIPWDLSLKFSILHVSGSDPDELTLYGLYQYVHAQKNSHQHALNYQLVFWQRVIQPLTTVVMMVLAIPFIFGSLRSSTMGSKLLLGASIGFCFHILNRFLGSMSQVYQFPPEIAAIAPTCIFALLGIYLMSRVS